MSKNTPEPELDEINSLLSKIGNRTLAGELAEAILRWHERRVQETMAKFGLKKGAEYDVKASDTVIVITPALSNSEQTNAE